MELSGVPEPHVIPMFPLGTVLFPHALLPLRVFEPRYRVMTERVLKAEREFGVVLIERGSEVGGGDTRFDVGTVAQIVRAEPLGDGGFVLATVGIRRVRVARWLPDDPYPQAEVVDFPDAEPDPNVAAGVARDRARDALEDVCAIYRQRDPRSRSCRRSPTIPCRRRTSWPRSHPSARSTRSGCSSRPPRRSD